MGGKKRVTGKTKLDTEATEEETVKGVARSNTVFLPNVTDADWPKELTEIDPKTRLKFVNIDAIKKAMAEQSKKTQKSSQLLQTSLWINPRIPTLTIIALIIKTALS